MRIFPKYSEVLVSACSNEEVERKLLAVTKRVNYLDRSNATNEPYLFNGQVNGDRFCLSLIINNADSFLPLIRGRVEPLKTGSILYLSYSLFPSSMFFLAFWGLVTLGAALLFIIMEQEWLYAAACLAAGAGNFAFAWSYFKRKLKQSQQIFHQMLSLQEKD